MANTTNIDLVKPAGTDHALVSVLNANSDKIDAEAGNVRSNFALVQNTNTATQSISKDQLVVWKGVLKKATSNIANGATLSNSNLTDTKVSTELASLSNQIGKYTPDAWRLFENYNVSTTQSDVNVTTGRSLANFNFINIIVFDANIIMATAFMPVSIFKTHSAELMWVNSANVQKSVNVEYSSDTVVKMAKSNNASETLNCYIYGVGGSVYPS